MMIERMLLQVLGIAVVGDFIQGFVVSKTELTRPIPRTINAILAGYFSLIFPMAIVGVFFVGHLDEFVFLYFGLSMGLTILAGIRLVMNEFSINLPQFDEFEKWTIFAICLTILGYFFMFAVMPERGWDGLNFYFPNALYFFLSDGIVPGLNPFSFYPTFKPPFNTLYLTYSFYVAKGMYANLHPFLLLLGTSCIIYQLSLDLDLSRHHALSAVLIFLFLPFTMFLVAEFAYYQEIPILFFSSATLYYLNRVQREIDHTSSRYLVIAMSMGILSKLSGYAVIYMVLLCITISPFVRKFQIGGITVLTAFLFRKAIYDISIQTGIIVILIALLLIYVIENYQTPKVELWQVVKWFAIPAIIGAFWIWFMLRIPQVDSFLVGTYIDNTSAGTSWVYPNTTVHEEILIEHGPRASFVTSALFIFTGSAFGVQYIFFKVRGIFQSRNYPILIRWMLSYLLLYYAYFSDVSARYLVPMMVPLSVFIAVGVIKFLQRFSSLTVQFIVLSSAVLNGFFFIIPVLPLRILRDGFLSFFYYFHTEYFSVYSYLIFITLLVIKFPYFVSKLSRSKIIAIRNTFFALLLIPPILIPVGVVSYAKVTDKSIDEVSSIYYRPGFQELVQFLQGLDLKFDEVIMSAITPGLSYFLRHPVIDIHMIKGQRELNVDLDKINMSQAIDFVDRFDIKVVVQVNNQSLAYNVYEQDYADLPIMQVVHVLPFVKVFSNFEFIVYMK